MQARHRSHLATLPSSQSSHTAKRTLSLSDHLNKATLTAKVRGGGIRDNIRRNIPKLCQLPNEFCLNCAGATCAINQSVERILSEQVRAKAAQSVR